MNIDMQTVYTASVLVLVLVGLLLLWSWLQDKRSMALVWWALSFFVSTAGVVLLSDYDLLPDVWSVDVAVVLLITGHGLVWAGVRSFDDRPVPWLGIAAGGVVWSLAYQTRIIETSATDRIGLIAVIAAIYTGVTAWEMFRDGLIKLRSGPLVLVLLVAHAACHVLRVPVAESFPYAFEAGASDIKVALLALEPMLFGVAIGYLFLLMTRERGEAEISTLAMTDVLTGSLNRRGFFDAAEDIRRVAQKQNQPVAKLLLDVDHFKEVNDTYGHAAGDEILQSFTVLVRGALRVDDVLGRIGGEEFAVMAVNADAEVAHALAERIRATVSESPIMWRETPIEVSVSIGVVCDPTAQRPLDDLLEIADRALYAAKRRGRNKVVLAEEPAEGARKPSSGRPGGRAGRRPS